MTDHLAVVWVADYRALSADCAAVLSEMDAPPFEVADGGPLPIKWSGVPILSESGAGVLLVLATTDAERAAYAAMSAFFAAHWPDRVEVLAEAVGLADWASLVSPWSAALDECERQIKADADKLAKYRAVVPEMVSRLDPDTGDPIEVPRGDFWAARV
ncbi:MAG: hypothetical protein HWE26_13640 [Alteromonadaceae bacterium]|nr:hypothetical protein [Alteromonadaceae bacterium]